MHWKFANPSTSCVRKGKQHAAVNRCNVTRIGSKYLTVPLVCSTSGIRCSHFPRLFSCRDRLTMKLPVFIVKSMWVETRRSSSGSSFVAFQYKPITPLIIVAQADMYDRMLYTFNVTAPGLGKQVIHQRKGNRWGSRLHLAPNQSFEILWAKRVEQQIEYSFVYWFLPR